MLKIYNTLTSKLEEFKSRKKNEVDMYVCGPTVYNYIHIGNARPIIFFDTVRRYLEYKGYKVNYVQNFTDIDDKMINKANEEGKSVKEIAEKFIGEYFKDTKPLNIKESTTKHPKATEYIGKMIKLVKELQEKGYAYESNGDVYFDVFSDKEYGKLSHQKVEDLISGARIEVNENKKNPLDFTLWKKAKENEPKWNSPWGEGRPGWHLECSVMSMDEFGETFDIHGGGQDLIFPHHENEIAQSECSTGKKFANYWMHNGYINIKGEKMSKSKGNFFLLREILEKYNGRILRFFVLSSHYRKPIEFSEDELKMAKTGLERIETFMKRIKLLINNPIENMEQSENKYLKEQLVIFKDKFEDGMDNDFNSSKSLGAIFELIKDLNKFLDKESNPEIYKNDLNEIYNLIKTILEDVFGVELELETKIEDNLTNELVELLLEIRFKAKNMKNWELADTIRNRLKKLNIVLKDGKDKTTWEIQN
ncbi:cysteine--tRNA ligase [Haliovirga abyssi]|uniref:Cysteine--tRNA ligase n=1 Tax=Haliovirga abyssi TaxID=2996794 RepID=A0AAU9D546_9FUSO|nr:cysteine--tRNA ligase [Haliovirga abyssi]BDU51176.1 cysteine--tRNA ligase [Haliovirga abyssi]